MTQEEYEELAKVGECPVCKAQKEHKVIDREAAEQLSHLDRGKQL